MSVLEISELSYRYKNSRENILLDVNQTFELGQFYAIIGSSGVGKSTLLSLLAGLDEPQEGNIYFKNEDIKKKGCSYHRRNHISLVFQNYNLIDYLTPLENVRLVNKKASPSLLLELGLNQDQIKRNVMKLSGGQQQRVAIARALASHAPIILADEPTGNLDNSTANEIIEILKKMAKKKINVLSLSHIAKKLQIVQMLFWNSRIRDYRLLNGRIRYDKKCICICNKKKA